jgi:hypothetical protein
MEKYIKKLMKTKRKSIKSQYYDEIRNNESFCILAINLNDTNFQYIDNSLKENIDFLYNFFTQFKIYYFFWNSFECSIFRKESKIINQIYIQSQNIKDFFKNLYELKKISDLNKKLEKELKNNCKKVLTKI